MNSFLDFLKVGGQTAVDIIAAQNAGPVTSAGPGTNPAALNAAAIANQTANTTNPPNYTPLILAGAGVLGVVVLLIVVSRK